MRTYKRLKAHNLSGFTIVELLVTLTIVVLVTGIIMIRYSSFNSSVLLSGQAYLTAFDIREAQALAVSVRGNQSEFKEEYGMYFTTSTPTEYLIFQDDDSNGDHTPVRYHVGEGLGTYKVDSRFMITNICVTTGGAQTCGIDDIAISFRRPDFDASFYSTEAGNITAAEIIFGSPNSTITRSVVVYSSGQISVD